LKEARNVKKCVKNDTKVKKFEVWNLEKGEWSYECDKYAPEKIANRDLIEWTSNFTLFEEPEPIILEEKPAEVVRKNRRATVMKRHDNNMYRRAYTETVLLDLMGETEFKDGDSYHFITGGDVDGLSYLKMIVRKQPLDYCLISSWVIASEDIFQIKDFLDEGKIKKLDVYIGEIFPNSFKLEFKMLKEVVEGYGRVCVFKNHSKVFAGYGDKFHFGVETSANINTNPRTENGCITIGKEIYEFYREYYDGINSFE